MFEHLWGNTKFIGNLEISDGGRNVFKYLVMGNETNLAWFDGLVRMTHKGVHQPVHWWVTRFVGEINEGGDPMVMAILF